MATVMDLKEHRSLHSARTEVLVRAFIIANGVGVAWPPSQLVSWMGVHTPDYDNTPEYWQPYWTLEHSQEVVVAPWARAAFNYLRSIQTDRELPEWRHIDPTVWHTGLAERMKALSMDPLTQAAVEVMHEHTDPNGYFGTRVQELHDDVRRAQDNGKLITDAARARRRLASVPKAQPQGD